MDDRSGYSICCIAWLDRSLDVGYIGYRGINFFKLFHEKSRTYGFLFLYLCIRLRDMKEAIKDLLIKAIVLTIIMIVIPLGVVYYISNPYISLSILFAYGSFIAMITDIK